MTMCKRDVLSLGVAGTAALMLFTGSAAGKDDNGRLRGAYAFSGEAACVGSTTFLDGVEYEGGFDGNLTPTGPWPHVFSYSIQGVRTFNGDGTGTGVGRAVSFGHPYALPTVPPYYNRSGAGSSDIEANFTYQVAPDGTFTIDQPLTLGTILAGSRTGQTLEIEGVKFVGMMSKDGATLTIASDEPIIETQTYFSTGVQNFKRKQICHRSRIHFKLD